MRPNSPSAILTSVVLHGFVAALVVLTTLYVARSEKVAPAIIELVAGPPTAPDALEAPALGNTTNPVKMNVPKVELPPEKVEPQAQETPSVPEPVKAEPAPVKPAKPDTSMVRQMNKQAKTSYKDWIKKNPIKPQAVASTARKPGKVQQVDVQGIAQGVRGGSTANTRGGGGGKAMTREETDQMTTYISFLVQALKQAYEAPSGVSDQLSAKVTFDLTASGAVLNARITKSSGNRDFDAAVLEAFSRVRSIGPTPNRRPHTLTITFKMSEDS